MKRSVLPAIPLLVSGRARAEVCDKYSGSWRLSDGPLDAWTIATSWPTVLLATALACACLLFRSRVLTRVVAAVFLVPALWHAGSWLFPALGSGDPVLASAIREGCMSGDPRHALTGAIVYGSIATTFLLLARFGVPPATHSWNTRAR